MLRDGTRYRINNGLVTWIRELLAQGGGNVGVGTGSPTAKLHVIPTLPLA
jgi:hypothetical protein